MYTTHALADFIRGFDSQRITPAAFATVKKCLLDLFGAALAGRESAGAVAMRRMARRLFGSGGSSVWFAQSPPLTAAAAALANSAAASALDLDDGHRAAAGHPGAAVIPAALAVAEQERSGAAELVAAVILGYEVSVRVAAGRDFATLDTLSTGRWSAYGVVAAAGLLQHASHRQLAEALAIAGVQAPGLSPAGYSSVMGNHIKEGIPWSVLTGLTALDLAAEGCTGPTDLLDHPHYYDAGKILAGLGRDSFAVETVYFKPYSCCRWIHSALDGLLQIMAEHHIAAEEIAGVTVGIFERALRLNNYPDPDSLEGAQYSIPFCLAVGALQGGEALLPMSGQCLGRPDLVAFAERVELRVEPALSAVFPDHVPARISVRTARGEFSQLVEDPRGDPGNPLSTEELEAKFCQLTRHCLTAPAQRAILAAVANLEELGVPHLMEALRTPLSP